MAFARAHVSLIPAPDDPRIVTGALQSAFGRYRQFLRMSGVEVSTSMYYHGDDEAGGYLGEFIIPLAQATRPPLKAVVIAWLGVDLDVRCIVDARPTMSLIRYVQSIGRGLRMAYGKDWLLILDHAGNIDEHNFVTDIIIEKLDDGKSRKKKAVKPKLTWKCCVCRAVMPKIEVFCTSCGAKAPGQTTIIEHDIELVEITAPMCAPVTTVPATPIFTHVPSTTSLEDPKRFYRELRGLAKARNYSPQWCNYSFQARFGNWPNAFGSASAVAPSPEIIAWVETRNRAYAARKRQEALAA